jgi:hypothetical protein
MALTRVVVPVKPVVLLGLGELMRSVAEWLIPGQTASAEKFFLAADYKLVRFMVSAFNDACHALLLCVERQKVSAAAYVSLWTMTPATTAAPGRTRPMQAR